MPTPAPNPPRHARPNVNPWAVLAVLCTSIFMLLLDTTIVNNAQRKIQIGLDAELSQIQWILDSYILVYAVLLLSFGRMGDIFGRKRFFVAGIVVFTLASGLCGLSPLIGDWLGVGGATTLIAARALQGFGGAMMMPQTLSIITQVFPPEKRGSAFGIWGSVVALGAVSGPVIGGAITTYYSWEWIFLINLPIGALGVVASARILPETRDPNASRTLDWGGVLLSGTAIFMLVFALIEGNRIGWCSPMIVALLAGATIIFAIFFRWEVRHPEPMVRLELFRIHNFAVSNAILMLVAFGVFGIFFPFTLFLQAGVGYTPLEAGLVTVPMSIMHGTVAPIAGRLTDRYGARPFIIGGLAMVTIGIALIAWQTTTETTWQRLMIPTSLTGAGMGTVMSPLTSAAMHDVPQGIAGSASGIFNTMRSIGQILGIAVLGTLLQTRTATEADTRLDRLDIAPALQQDLVDKAEASQFEEIVARLDTLPDSIPLLLPPIQHAFADAAQFTFFTNASIAAVTLLIAFQIRSPQRAEKRAAQPARPRERPQPVRASGSK
ncbi:MAG TPA: MFS transporter [Thermomicrobiales bacterium]|nr:MFS transporter [Thermomicrobiales bacterium]